MAMLLLAVEPVDAAEWVPTAGPLSVPLSGPYWLSSLMRSLGPLGTFGRELRGAVLPACDEVDASLDMSVLAMAANSGGVGAAGCCRRGDAPCLATGTLAETAMTAEGWVGEFKWLLLRPERCSCSEGAFRHDKFDLLLLGKPADRACIQAYLLKDCSKD